MFLFIIRNVHFWLLFLQSALCNFQMGLDTKLELRWWHLDAEWITAAAYFLYFPWSAEQYYIIYCTEASNCN